MEDDLQEWEMLHNPEEIDSSEGDSPKTLIRSDYFAFGSNSNHVLASTQVEDFEPNDCIGGGGEGSDLPVPVLEEEEDDIKDFEGNPNNNMGGEGEGEGEEIEMRETPVCVVEASNDGVSERIVPQNQKMVWWKHPFQLLKFCVFRVSPLWTFSLAAALVGILILNKRFSTIKQKTRTIPIKLTVEDKKVSQFMVRAARLNEAFSVVRRVPIIRPILPSGGVTPWPALNLR